jgi:hypothetical protein
MFTQRKKEKRVDLGIKLSLSRRYEREIASTAGKDRNRLLVV